MGQGCYDVYVRTASRMKAKDAKIIPADTIVAAQWVREKCQFGCGGYGKNLTCPPNSPTPEQTSRMLTHYKHVLLIHGDEETPITRIVAVLEREIFLDGHYKAFGMGAGSCSICEECVEPCKYPHQARPSMEACGIDVYTTVRANGFPIQVLKDEGCKGNYYGLVLID